MKLKSKNLKKYISPRLRSVAVFIEDSITITSISIRPVNNNDIILIEEWAVEKTITAGEGGTSW